MSKLTRALDEATRGYGEDGSQYVHINQLRNAVRRMKELEAMLRKHEWSGWDSEYYRKQLCPECGAWNEDPSGHSPDCALAKLLE